MTNIHALVHNSLMDGDAVQPLTESDKVCFEAIREILQKHGKIDRFGIALLHKHFDLEEDEMLIENVDEVSRTQIIRPIKRAEVEQMGGTVLETLWSLHEGEVVMGCRRACVQQGGSHSRTHVYTGTTI